MAILETSRQTIEVTLNKNDLLHFKITDKEFSDYTFIFDNIDLPKLSNSDVVSCDFEIMCAESLLTPENREQFTQEKVESIFSEALSAVFEKIKQFTGDMST